MTDAIIDYDAIDFFRGDELVDDPYPYFDWLRDQCPVRREPAARRVHGHRVRRGVRRLHGHRHLLVVQLGDGAVPGFPGPARGAGRRERADRGAPRRAAVQRPDHHDGPARAPRPPAPAHAPAHAEAAEGERGVRVAARRPPDRRVHRAGRVRVHRRLRQPVHAVRHRRPPRCPRGGAPGVPRRPGPPARRAAPSAAPRTRCRTARWHGSTTGSAATSRTAGASRATTCSPRLATTTFPNGELPEVIDVVRVAANVFAAGQETTVRLLGTALQLIGERPDLQQLLRERRDLIPELRRGDAPHRGSGQGRLPAGPAPGHGRRGRHPRRRRR